MDLRNDILPTLEFTLLSVPAEHGSELGEDCLTNQVERLVRAKSIEGSLTKSEAMPIREGRDESMVPSSDMSKEVSFCDSSGRGFLGIVVTRNMKFHCAAGSGRSAFTPLSLRLVEFKSIDGYGTTQRAGDKMDVGPSHPSGRR